MAGRDLLREWLQVALEAYERSFAVMMQDGVAAAAVVAEAHKVRGSSGTLGMAQAGALATEIEEAAKHGRVADDMIVQLREIVAATRRELERRSLA